METTVIWPKTSRKSRARLTAAVFLYRLYGVRGQLLYAGIADDVEVRLEKHAVEKIWWAQVTRVEVMAFGNRQQALWAEWAVVSTCRPTYNRIMYPPAVSDGTPPGIVEDAAPTAPTVPAGHDRKLAPVSAGHEAVAKALAEGRGLVPGQHYCKPSTMAGEVNLSTRRVHDILKDLVEQGVVRAGESQGHYHPTGKQLAEQAA